MVRMGLEKGVGVGLHVGESKGEIERQDVEEILRELEEWAFLHSPCSSPLFYGKIRLGHGIYLTDEQKKRVFALSLPVEVCPTCHLRINWHTPPTPHPISLLYSSLSLPLSVGTDDCLVFGATSMEEWEKMKLIFSFPEVRRGRNVSRSLGWHLIFFFFFFFFF